MTTRTKLGNKLQTANGIGCDSEHGSGELTRYAEELTCSFKLIIMLTLVSKCTYWLASQKMQQINQLY